MQNDEIIWLFLKAKGLSDYAAAGIEGNLRAESACNPTNLQNSYEKKLNMTDEEYTRKVDSGEYKNFENDSAGYGLAQWTYHTRKRNLLLYAKSRGCSIGDLNMQLNFLWNELTTNYKGIITSLQQAQSIRAASDIILTQYEKPADQGTAVKNTRAKYAEEYYNKFAEMKKNSALVDCAIKSPHHSGKRTHSIDRITPHCTVGQMSVESIGACFQGEQKKSCNYGIGTDGKVCLIVDEENRSWCSSSSANDQRAVTIECASDSYAPYAFNDAVYNKLIELCVDVCRRNGKSKLIWIQNKEDALRYTPREDEMQLTVHRWFSNKSCPGDWLFSRMKKMANEVSYRLRKQGEQVEERAEEDRTVQEDAVRKWNEGDIIKLKPGATYYDGRAIPTWVFKSTLYYRRENENGVVFSTKKTGAITGVIKKENIE